MASRFGNEYYVYRYTEKASGRVVYIGKTNCSLKARVDAHRREEWFSPYDCDVDCVRLSNAVETDSIEKFLINFYKPVINLKDKIPFQTKEINLQGLEWIPYSSYLNEIKHPSNRKAVLKRDALKQVKILDKILESENGKIVSSDMVLSLPMNDSLFQFAKIETTRVSEGYEYQLKEESKEFVSTHYYEVLASIWRPLINISDISEARVSDFATCEYALELVDLLKEFAYNGYLSEDYFEQFVAVVPSKYKAAFDTYFSKYTEDFNLFGSKLYFEWTRYHSDFLVEIIEDICKGIVKFARLEGIYEYDDEEY